MSNPIDVRVLTRKDKVKAPDGKLIPLVVCPVCGKTAIYLGIEQSERKVKTYAHIVEFEGKQGVVDLSCSAPRKVKKKPAPST